MNVMEDQRSDPAKATDYEFEASDCHMNEYGYCDIARTEECEYSCPYRLSRYND